MKAAFARRLIFPFCGDLLCLAVIAIYSLPSIPFFFFSDESQFYSLAKKGRVFLTLPLVRQIRAFSDRLIDSEIGSSPLSFLHLRSFIFDIL